MARPKGSKNRIKKQAEDVRQPIAGLEAQILASDEAIAAMTAQIAELRSELLKEKRNNKKRVKKLEALKKAQEEDAAAALAEAKKAEAEQVVANLLASGKSAEEILKLIKS